MTIAQHLAQHGEGPREAHLRQARHPFAPGAARSGGVGAESGTGEFKLDSYEARFQRFFPNLPSRVGICAEYDLQNRRSDMVSRFRVIGSTEG